jgi:hypothetical protein
MSRTYTGGRPTTGWRKGEKVTDLAQVRAGDVLIAVCHQFKAENLVRVEEVLTDLETFHWEYITPEGKLTGEYGGGAHGFELSLSAIGFREYFQAIKQPTAESRDEDMKLLAWHAATKGR